MVVLERAIGAGFAQRARHLHRTPLLVMLAALTVCGCGRAHDESHSAAAIVDSALHALPSVEASTPVGPGSAGSSEASAAPPIVAPAPSVGVGSSVSLAPVTPSARAATVVKAVKKPRGASCSAANECGAGLACCQTGFRGHCGGAALPELQDNPCVFLSTCTPPPCAPLRLPP